MGWSRWGKRLGWFPAAHRREHWANNPKLWSWELAELWSYQYRRCLRLGWKRWTDCRECARVGSRRSDSDQHNRQARSPPEGPEATERWDICWQLQPDLRSN